ncbi:beta-glucuronidase [Curtobacterium sp. S6]|uniref:beta-glucuronidase n=1 Tax=Curtobacterium sp. S6 TaxID=1479623 RepID=UPI0004AB2482|nr:beta-glucuronidase [Curtobacterium sp. S6]
MLRPQETSTRQRVALDGLFGFAVDWNHEGFDAGWAAGPPDQGLKAPVPGSFNDLFADQQIREHVGWVWYSRRARVPRSYTSGRTILRVDSATHRGVVFVNGTEVARHQGGYLPFEADVTELVSAGEEFTLTIAVNNELSHQTLPPGEVTQDDDGRKHLAYRHDFFNYAGIHRSVWLYNVAEDRLEDVTVTTSFSGGDGGTGTVSYAARFSMADARVIVRVIDAEGRTVASAEPATAADAVLRGELSWEQVHLWRPGRGYLYTLRVQVLDGEDIVDDYNLRFGVRTVEVRGKQFLINDEPFYFTGFGMHEDHETIGKAHSDAHMVQDFALLDWVNANSFRTSHYPYSEEIMDYADERGIVVIDETPAVGLNWHMGAGIMDQGGGNTFDPGNIDEKTREVHARDIAELIDRDKNHPSVVLWSIANEPDSGAEGAREYFEPLEKLTRRLDPSRPVGFVNVMFAPCGVDKISDLFDVLMLNRYYGWYENSGDIEGARKVLRAELEAWDKQYGKPTLMTEYGADTVAGLHSVYDVPFTEEYQTALLGMYHEEFDRVECMVGEQVWNFADFQTKNGFARVDGNKKGAFTRDRKPKALAHHLRARWAAKLGR